MNGVPQGFIEVNDPTVENGEKARILIAVAQIATVRPAAKYPGTRTYIEYSNSREIIVDSSYVEVLRLIAQAEKQGNA